MQCKTITVVGERSYTWCVVCERVYVDTQKYCFIMCARLLAVDGRSSASR